ncbi:hypothetical protein PBY51_019910 [Eleginops maclovinus]|uniref:Uncharacterized protein n=1 Tax=Eleginops maclovinus TaxID=56733 RepID=A0AAN7XRQ6_ELEMC|nr:hypothetical protein PBY51_019910 [Eleginops maclovinus]
MKYERRTDHRIRVREDYKVPRRHPGDQHHGDGWSETSSLFRSPNLLPCPAATAVPAVLIKPSQVSCMLPSSLTFHF